MVGFSSQLSLAENAWLPGVGPRDLQQTSAPPKKIGETCFPAIGTEASGWFHHQGENTVRVVVREMRVGFGGYGDLFEPDGWDANVFGETLGLTDRAIRLKNTLVGIYMNLLPQ